MKRAFSIVLIFIALMTGVAFAENNVLFVFCNPNDFVNARQSPTTNSTIEGTYYCGDAVETDGVVKTDKQGRKWAHVVDSGFELDSVWVCCSYLQETEIVVINCFGYVASNGRVALRRSPNGKRVKWLNNGDVVNIVAMSDEWALTTCGYVQADCLDIYYENIFEGDE